MRRFLYTVVTAASAVAGSRQAAACDRPLPSHLRILDCRLADAAAVALGQSPTLREQVTQIEALSGAVYVTTRDEIRTANGRRLLGETVDHIDVAGSQRIVRVEVTKACDAQGIATLGHELHHVIEILRGVDAGEYRSVSSTTLETEAAFKVERMILHELRSVRDRR